MFIKRSIVTLLLAGFVVGLCAAPVNAQDLRRDWEQRDGKKVYPKAPQSHQPGAKVTETAIKLKDRDLVFYKGQFRGGVIRYTLKAGIGDGPALVLFSDGKQRDAGKKEISRGLVIKHAEYKRGLWVDYWYPDKISPTQLLKIKEVNYAGDMNVIITVTPAVVKGDKVKSPASITLRATINGNEVTHTIQVPEDAPMHPTVLWYNNAPGPGIVSTDDAGNEVRGSARSTVTNITVEATSPK